MSLKVLLSKKKNQLQGTTLNADKPPTVLIEGSKHPMEQTRIHCHPIALPPSYPYLTLTFLKYNLENICRTFIRSISPVIKYAVKLRE